MKHLIRSTLRIIAVACLVFFVIGLLFAVPPFIQQMKVLRTWPAADAQVIHSQVVPLRTDSGQMLYDTLLVLSYQANGRPYVSSVGSLHQSTSYERKKKQADRFPPGSNTEVRYNPSDPHDIRIQAGYNVHFFAVPVFISGVAAIFGLLALLFFLLSRRRPEPALSRDPA
ncbi:MAG TPA: DUF3592 domain-containing protein [Terriglobales bacterium]|nr:DUF3592 domain-containing protein [Terriglobales bacterium]